MNVLEVDFEKKLKNFPLHIQFQAEGGCIGILGASGCGKSMTFKVIAGIATPDSGKICLGKRELFHRGHKSAAQKTQCGIFVSELCLISQYDSVSKY